MRTAAGATSRWLFTADGQEIAESGGPAGQTLVRRQVFGAGADEPLVEVSGAPGARVRLWYHVDAQGSVVARSDAAGAVPAGERYSYTPWGERGAGSGSASAFGWVGRRADAVTGQVDLRARVYAPGLGRFLQPDPIGAAGGVNLYAYVGNDPMNATDPEGLLAQQLGSAAWGLLTPGGRASQQAFAEFQRGNYGSAALQFGIGLAEAGAAVATTGVGVVASAAGRGVRAVGSLAPVAAEARSEFTRVGRWMSRQEFTQMTATGRVVEGGGGRTYVIRPPNPGGFTSARPGSVYAEFDVPSGSLRPGSRPDWAVIAGPNVTTRIYGPPPSQMPPATCIICRIGD